MRAAVPPARLRRELPVPLTVSRPEAVVACVFIAVTTVTVMSAIRPAVVFLGIMITLLPLYAPLLTKPDRPLTAITPSGQPALHSLTADAAALAGWHGRLFAALGPIGSIEIVRSRVEGVRSEVLSLDPLLVKRLPSTALFDTVTDAVSHGAVTLDESLLRRAFVSSGDPVALGPAPSTSTNSGEAMPPTSSLPYRSSARRLACAALIWVVASSSLACGLGTLPGWLAVLPPSIATVFVMVRWVRVVRLRRSTPDRRVVTAFANDRQRRTGWSSPTTWMRIDAVDARWWQRVMWEPALAAAVGPVSAEVRSASAGTGHLITLRDGTSLIPVGRSRRDHPRGSQPRALAEAMPSRASAIIEPTRRAGIGRLLDVGFHVTAGVVGAVVMTAGAGTVVTWTVALWVGGCSFCWWALSTRPQA